MNKWSRAYGQLSAYSGYQEVTELSTGLNLDPFSFKYSKLFNFSAIFVSVTFCDFFKICNSFLSIQLYSKYLQSNLEVPNILRSLSSPLTPTVLGS